MVTSHWSLRSVRIILALVLVLVIGRSAQAADTWSTIKGKHFFVKHRSDEAFAKKTLKTAEKYYDQIVKDLGCRRHDKFWLWENRVTIFVYEDRASFAADTGAPSWAAAKADHKAREIAGVKTESNFLKGALAHEMAHLVFRESIGFKAGIPLWLNEGVAQWCEKDDRLSNHRAMKASLVKGIYIPLSTLFVTDVRKTKDPKAAGLFYTQSASVVAFMIEKSGIDKFKIFCEALRDGEGTDDALDAAYSKDLESVAKLEKAWKVAAGK